MPGAWQRRPGPIVWMGGVVVGGLMWVGTIGCGQPESKPASPTSASQTPSQRNMPPIPPHLTGASASTEKPTSGSSRGASASEAPQENGGPRVREKAVVGVSPKGKGYGGGLITEPISVYFKAPQMVVFQIQIPHAMNLYRGTHGHFPKSHQEFMEKIIQENGIHLPDLPPGARYVYDPQKAAGMQQYDPADPPLFVERPAP